MTFPSVLSIFKIAVGPSSSHTLGCIRIGQAFRGELIGFKLPQNVRLHVELLGSLAHTGKGHLSDLAVVAGLTGYSPEEGTGIVLSDTVERIEREQYIQIRDDLRVSFVPSRNLIFNFDSIPIHHPNTIIFTLQDEENREIMRSEYISTGGGNIARNATPIFANTTKEGTFCTFSQVLKYCRERNYSLFDFILEHERDVHDTSPIDFFARLEKVWRIMVASLDRGIATSGLLPGELKLERRAKEMFANYLRNLREWRMLAREITLSSIYAIAIAEENASGGRVVTAPTCGSAGVVPAVLHMLKERYHMPESRVLEGLAVAGFVGSIAVRNASISGAEVGCQGEVGVASAMAAAASCYLIGGNVQQIECAAEIALEHHLGLTCDPIGGLVQIPCIERNAAGAVAALNACNLALLSDGEHRVSFDASLRAMKEIGRDMNCKYKETALGGLATTWSRRTQF